MVKNLNEMDREYKLASAIPTELVEKISKSSANCEGVWQEAREKSDFNLVKKDLEELINLTKEEANILGEELVQKMIQLHESGKIKVED